MPLISAGSSHSRERLSLARDTLCRARGAVGTISSVTPVITDDQGPLPISVNAHTYKHDNSSSNKDIDQDYMLINVIRDIVQCLPEIDTLNEG